MKNFKYILIALVCAMTFSCKKSEYFLYKDVSRIQFGQIPEYIYFTFYRYSDTLKQQTFYYKDATVVTDTVYFDIYAIGGVKDKDRSFSLKQEQVPGQYNAVSGVHYRDFKDTGISGRYVIKAGQVHCRMPVVLLRDQSLRSNTAVLKLVVVENENFKFGQENLLWRKVVFTDRLNRPDAWTDSYATYSFGKYSMIRHKFMIDSTGQKWDQEFVLRITNDSSEELHWVSVVKEALIAYNLAHPNDPLKDEFGEITMPN